MSVIHRYSSPRHRDHRDHHTEGHQVQVQYPAHFYYYSPYQPIFHEFALSKSRYDRALYMNDLQSAQVLVWSSFHIDGHYQRHFPLLTLGHWVQGRPGDESFNDTLHFYLQNGIYEVKADFLEHVLDNYSNENVIKVFKSIQGYKEPQKSVLHKAIKRGLLLVVRTLVNVFQFDVDGLDDLGQSPIFYLVERKFSCFKMCHCYLQYSSSILQWMTMLKHWTWNRQQGMDSRKKFGTCWFEGSMLI